jgi:MPBQ/MSBQ methyltransferase
VTDQQARIALRKHVYGTGDLSTLSVFAGGFINFGYWRDLPADDPIPVEVRTASQQAMYELVLDVLGVSAGHRVLEVGCGRGLGGALALRRDPALVRGVDLVPEQVARAAAANHDDRLAFEQGSASAIPFPDRSFDRLLSVEAAQHFEDVSGFARESFRVLVPGGRLVVASFFATAEGHADELAELLHTFANGLDLPHVVGAVLTDLRAAGFVDVAATSIGEHVWPAFDHWVGQIPGHEPWERNWLEADQRCLLDYYLITAARPGEAGSQA